MPKRPSAKKRPVALVTGASRGIGFATAEALAEAGFDLVVTATSRTGTDLVSTRVRQAGGHVLAAQYQAKSRTSADALVKSALETFGQIDVLVLNAGMVIRKGVTKLIEDEFDQVLQVNLSAPFGLVKRVLPSMLQRKAGRIVFVSSISATLGSPNNSAYAASKWGLEGLMKSVAEETRGTGVFVASVLPGSTDTDMLKGSGFEPQMSPQQVAGVIRYLATDAPTAMHGSGVQVFG